MNAENTSISLGTRIPMVQTGQALLSLRDSGHNLPTALGEVLDNSIEAKANNILIRLDQAEDRQGKKHIHRIAVADDGTGMDVDILHHYLVLGFSTRYMRIDTIGKYGVGAKLAALNFGRRIDVWSRDSAAGEWMHVYFDLDEAMREEATGEIVGLDAPTSLEVPSDFADLLPASTGTLVVWSNVDRLEDGRLAANFDELRLELEKELSRIFRHFIQGGIKISINAKEIVAHDPLMRMTGSWSDLILTRDREKTGDKRSDRKALVPEHFPATLIAEDEIRIGGCKAKLTVTLYPKEVIRKRGMGGDKLATMLRVPENQGAISFVRLNREVSYTNVPRIFPSGVQDPDRFIGIEVSFKPELDEFFGIRNVKRGVEPHGELRVKIRELLKKHVSTARKMIEEAWGIAAREDQEKDGEHNAVMTAVKDVDATMPKSRADEVTNPDDVEQALKDLAQDVGRTKEEEKQEYVDRIRELPFVIESVDFPGNMFITTQHLAGKVIIRINTRHPFYRDMWEPIKSISERDAGTVSGDEAVKTARRTIEALTLLLIAYGKAESMHSNPSEHYSDLTAYWGQFLQTLMQKVKNVI